MLLAGLFCRKFKDIFFVGGLDAQSNAHTGSGEVPKIIYLTSMKK